MAKAQGKSSSKYVNHIKKSATFLKELDKYNNIIDDIDKLGRLALHQEDCKIEMQVYIKVTPNKTEEKTDDSKESLLDAIKNSETPEAFLEQLSKARDNKDADPKYHELQIDELDNSTFLAMLDKILGNYKALSTELLTKIKSITL